MKRKIAYFILATVITAIPVNAQKFMQDALLISDISLWQQGNSLYVDMTIDMRNLKIGSEQSLVLTPVLTDNQHNVALQSIMINGRQRQKAYSRSIAMSHQTPASVVIPYQKRDVLTYTQEIPYQAWMENASLTLDENLCGCGGHEEMIAQELISNNISTENKRLSGIHPMVVYIQPKTELIKVRSEQYEAHLDFPVNKSTILPDYMNNRTELANIHSMFTQIEKDQNLTVTGVSIVGYASPEGPLKYNEQLSQKRAESLRDYLIGKERTPAGLYKVTFGGENWDGLTQALETSSLEGKQTILDIIRSTPDNSLRKQKVMSANSGAPYRNMMTDIYPRLRKVDCQINYTVKKFDVEQAKEVIKTNPKYLSIEEMYMAANSYPKGSKEFSDIFEVAVRMFPDDATANLNAAAAELSQSNPDYALRYMKKADQSTSEYINNYGVYYFQKGNYQKALDSFEKAAQMGNETAQTNKQQLENVLNTKR